MADYYDLVELVEEAKNITFFPYEAGVVKNVFIDIDSFKATEHEKRDLEELERVLLEKTTHIYKNGNVIKSDNRSVEKDNKIGFHVELENGDTLGIQFWDWNFLVGTRCVAR